MNCEEREDYLQKYQKHVDKQIELRIKIAEIEQRIDLYSRQISEARETLRKKSMPDKQFDYLTNEINIKQQNIVALITQKEEVIREKEQREKDFYEYAKENFKAD